MRERFSLVDQTIRQRFPRILRLRAGASGVRKIHNAGGMHDVLRCKLLIVLGKRDDDD